MPSADDKFDAQVAAAMKRLDARAQREADETPAPDPTPTVTRFNVLSDLTGAVVCAGIESRSVAEGEAARLNGESAKVRGSAGLDRGRTLHEGTHRGRVTTYSVHAIEVADREAIRTQNVERLEALIAGDDDGRRPAYERELAQYRKNEGLDG